MLPEAGEKEGDELRALGGGAPQTPAGGRRLPAPPAELLSFLALVDLIDTDGSRH